MNKKPESLDTVREREREREYTVVNVIGRGWKKKFKN